MSDEQRVAGRSLDAEIATLMGWERGEPLFSDMMIPPGDDREVYWVIPEFSSRIECAWDVVGKMNADGFRLELNQSHAGVSIYFQHFDEAEEIADERELYTPSRHVAATICRAALDARTARTLAQASLEHSPSEDSQT